MDRSLALHLRNIAALIDANVPADRFDDEVRTLLCTYGRAALEALRATDALDDPRGAGALLRYSVMCPSCYQDTTKIAHRASCELAADVGLR
jgi:hypothetical protein